MHPTHQAAGQSPVASVLQEGAARGRGARSWSMVGILSLMLLLSFIDRFSLSIFVAPIRHDLSLSDAQVGLLLGVAFGAVYSVVGLPSGYLIDRFNRRNLLLSGVVIWSLMTMLSGMATSFGVLFVGRMGVGFGEAVLTPVAYSMIRDGFDERRRSRAYGVYLFGSFVGLGASLVVISWLSRLFASFSGRLGPLSGLHVWQQVLFAIGAAGIPIAALGLAIREPARRGLAAGESADMRAFIRYAVTKREIYVPLLVAHAVWGICIYSYGAWLPTALARGWDIPAARVGSTYGTIAMCMAPIVTFLLSPGLDRIARWRGDIAVPVIAGVGSLLFAVPVAIGPLALGFSTTWIALGLSSLFSMLNQLSLALILACVTPGRMVGKATSTAFLALNLVGFGAGPSLVAALSGHLGPSSGAIGQALSIVSTTGWIVVAIMLLCVACSLRKCPSKG